MRRHWSKEELTEFHLSLRVAWGWGRGNTYGLQDFKIFFKRFVFLGILDQLILLLQGILMDHVFSKSLVVTDF